VPAADATHLPSGEQFTPGLAFQQLGDDVGRAVAEADIVHSEDVPVVQRSDGPRFLGEAAEAIGVGRDRVGEDLDRHVAPEPGVAGAVDRAHAPGANQLEDLVRTQPRARSQGHCGLRGAL